jgi:CDP-diacylglycerol--glycerol-3-phosphate 3-phosphatidyltransferase
MITIPNILTLIRIAVIPVFVGVFYMPFPWANALSASIFGLAALTDLLDGYLARRLGQTSRFGAFLDPVADKLMVAVVLVFLLEVDPTPWLAVPVAVIIGREIAISALREWMAEIGARAKVGVAWIGKIKTVVQMTALFLMLWGNSYFDLPIYKIGFTLLYVAAVLTLWSMIVYLRAAIPTLIGDEDHILDGSSLDSDPAVSTIRCSDQRE